MKPTQCLCECRSSVSVLLEISCARNEFCTITPQEQHHSMLIRSWKRRFAVWALYPSEHTFLSSFVNPQQLWCNTNSRTDTVGKCRNPDQCSLSFSRRVWFVLSDRISSRFLCWRLEHCLEDSGCRRRSWKRERTILEGTRTFTGFLARFRVRRFLSLIFRTTCSQISKNGLEIAYS